MAFLTDFLVLQPSLVLLATVALTWRNRLMGANRWLDINAQRAVRRARRVISALEMTWSSVPAPPDCHRLDTYHPRPSEERLKSDRTAAFQAKRTSIFFKKLLFNFVVTVLLLIITYGRFSTRNYDQVTAVKKFLIRSNLPRNCTASQFLDWSLTSFPERLFEEPSGPTYATGSVLIGPPVIEMCLDDNCSEGNLTALIHSVENNGSLGTLKDSLNSETSKTNLVLKFLLYNPASNIFNAVFVRGYFWRTAPGEVHMSVSPCHLLKTVDDSVLFLPCIEVVFFIVMAYLTKNEIWRIGKNGRKYASFSSLTSFLLCTFSFVLLVQLVHFSAYAQDTVKEFREVRSVAVETVQTLAYFEWVILSELSFMVFLQCLLWLSVFQFLPPFQVAARILSRIWKEATAIVVLFCMMLVGHGLVTSLALPPDFPINSALHSLLLVLRHGPVPSWKDQPGHDAAHAVYCFTLAAIFFVTVVMIKASLMNNVRSRRQLQAKPKVSWKQVARSYRQKLSMKANSSSGSTRSLSSLVYPPFEFLLHEMEKAMDELQSRADRLFPDTWLAVDEENEDDENGFQASSSSCDTPSISDPPEGSQFGCSTPPEIQPSPGSTRLYRSMAQGRASPLNSKVRRTRTHLNPDSFPSPSARGVMIRKTKSQGKGKGLQLEGLLDSQETDLD